MQRRKSPKCHSGYFCPFWPASMVWYIFQTSFFKTVMNRRSNIIKGPYQLEDFFSQLFMYSSIPHIHTSIPQCFLSEKHCGSVHVFLLTECINQQIMKYGWDFLPYATISITGYKLATSFLKDIMYFCPFLKMEGVFRRGNDHVTVVSKKKNKVQTSSKVVVSKNTRDVSARTFSSPGSFSS